MVPQFNGGAYNPAIANNGNPNTVYNTAPGDDQRVPYMPAFEQPLGGGMQANYGMLQTEQAVKPLVTEPAATPMPKPPVMPDLRKPLVPETVASNWAKPRVPELAQPAVQPRGMVSYGNITLPQVTDTNADRRSPMAITLPEIAAPDGQLRGTAFGTGTDYWRTRLESLNSTLPQIPIPGVTQPQPGGGGTAPTGPGTVNPTQPERPRLPGLGTTTPDENGTIRGPDPIDYGRRAEVANGFGSGNFTGMGALLGLQGRQAAMFNSRVSDIYNGMYPEQRAQFSADAATVNNPDAPEADKQSAWQRLTSWLSRQRDEFFAELQDLNWWDAADLITGIPGSGNAIEGLFNRIGNNGYFSDTRPMRPGQTGTVTVGDVGAPRVDIPVQPVIRDTIKPDFSGGTAPASGGGGASGGTGGNAGSAGGMTGAGGSSRIVNPWDQKPGSRLPRRPS